MAGSALSGLTACGRLLLPVYLMTLLGCVSESAPVTSSSRPMSDLTGQWEVDYARVTVSKPKSMLGFVRCNVKCAEDRTPLNEV